MKLLSVALLLAASLSALPAQSLRAAEGRQHTSKRVWIRRVTLLAGCAASLLFDTMTTQRVAAEGGIESNRLLADAHGRPQWGRMIGAKASVCGASAILQETHVFGVRKSPSADWTWVAVNATVTSVYTWGGIHNLKLSKELSGEPSRGNF